MQAKRQRTTSACCAAATICCKLTIAGSISNTARMDLMNELGCKAYTMGSALFGANFVKGGSFRENLEFVLHYLEGK